MSKEIIYTNKAPEPIGPYSQAIKLSYENPFLIYTSGQVAIDPSTSNMIEGDIKAQTHRVMKNIIALLEESGTTMQNVIKTTVFLKSMDEFAAMNEVYAEYFGDSKPARSTVEVVRLPKNAKVEIEVIAYI